MKGKLLQFQQNDFIKASVQKEEITSLIRGQRLKQQPQELGFNRTANFQERRRRSRVGMRPATFNIRKKSTNRRSQIEEQFKQQWEDEMKEKINYFSVRKDYEHIINKTKDERVLKLLKEELAPETKPKYMLRSQTPKSCNFFEKVLNKQSKVRQFLKNKPFSFSVREQGLKESQTHRSFFQYNL